MEVREVLEGMLDILHEKEWIKGHLYKVGDRFYDSGLVPEAEGVCLEGACNLTLLGIVEHRSDEWRLLKYLAGNAVIRAAAHSCPEKYQSWMSVMFQFNDDMLVTREDVILAVKTALIMLEES